MYQMVKSLQVCKTAFQSIFVLSDGQINRALKAQAADGGSPHTDKRKPTLLSVNKLDQCKHQKPTQRKAAELGMVSCLHQPEEDGLMLLDLRSQLPAACSSLLCQASCNQRASKPISFWKHSNISIPADKPEWQGGIQSKKRCNLLYLHTKQKKGEVDTLRGYTAYGYCSSLNPRWGRTSMNRPSLIPRSPCPGWSM